MFDDKEFDRRAAEVGFAQSRPRGGLDDLGIRFQETFEQRTIFAEERERTRHYEEQQEIISQALGRSIPYPDQRLITSIGPIEGLHVEHSGVSIEQAEAEYYAELAEVADQLPEGVVFSPEERDRLIGVQRKALRDEADEVRSNTSGVVANVAGFVADAAGQLADPVLAPALVIGAPARAGTTLASRVLTTAITEAGIGASIEALIQADVQHGRQSFGEEADLEEALESVLIAGGAGAVLGGTITALQGLYRRYRATEQAFTEAVDNGTIKPTAEQRASVRDVQEAVHEFDTNIFPSTPAGMAAHQRAFAQAYEAVQRGEQVQLDFGPSLINIPSRGRPEFTGSLSIGGVSANEILATEAFQGFARNIHKMSDERVADILSSVQAKNPPIEDLSDFLLAQGGVSYREFGRRGRPTKLFAIEGMALEDAVRLAQREGFPVRDVDDLKSKLAVGAEPTVRQENLIDLRSTQQAARLRAGLRAAGIDFSGNDIPEFRRSVQRALESQQEAVSKQEVAPPTAFSASLDEAQALSVAELAETENPTVFVDDGNGQQVGKPLADILQEHDELEVGTEVVGVCLGRLE